LPPNASGCVDLNLQRLACSINRVKLLLIDATTRCDCGDCDCRTGPTEHHRNGPPSEERPHSGTSNAFSGLESHPDVNAEADGRPKVPGFFTLKTNRDDGFHEEAVSPRDAVVDEWGEAP
jgi:hypothetical protein